MRELIIREGNIFFEEQVSFHAALGLKICAAREIYKFREFQWSNGCRRWEQRAPIRLPWPAVDHLPLEVYAHDPTGRPEVLGEGGLVVRTVAAYLDREITIPLTYDGAYVGCLYCVVSDREEENHQLSRHFLYMHKLELAFTDPDPLAFTLRLTKNQGPAEFEKEFHVHQLVKTLFPNIKVPVKMSDVFTVQLGHPSVRVKPVRFVVDSIKRGKTSVFEVRLRVVGSSRSRVADLKIEYFLDNIYLENERQIFTRKGIVAQNILPVQALAVQEKERIRRSVIIRQIEEADRRILKLDRGVRKFIRTLRAQDRQNEAQASLDGQDPKEPKTWKESEVPKAGKENDPMHCSAPAQLKELRDPRHGAESCKHERRRVQLKRSLLEEENIE